MLGGTCPRTETFGGQDNVMQLSYTGLERSGFHVRSMLIPRHEILQQCEETKRVVLPVLYIMLIKESTLK